MVHFPQLKNQTPSIITMRMMHALARALRASVYSEEL
jgi:hypothetical protein